MHRLGVNEDSAKGRVPVVATFLLLWWQVTNYYSIDSRYAVEEKNMNEMTLHLFKVESPEHSSALIYVDPHSVLE